MKTLKYNFKGTILAILIAITSMHINAQDTTNARQKGNILLGGGALVHFTSHKYNNNENTSFTTNITPKIGYFIIDNLTTGVEFSIKTSKETRTGGFLGEQKITSNTFSIAPFARYYLKNGFFAEGLVGIGTAKTNNSSSLIGDRLGGTKTNIFGFRAGVGYAVNLGEHIAIEPSINYSWERSKQPDLPSSTLKNTLSSIFLGIHFTVFL